MVWVGFLMWALVWGAIGSFGTAFIHERQGRDVQMGGLLGLVIGTVGGIFFLMVFWVWLYYDRGLTSVGRVYNLKRRWYNWWD